MLKDVSEISQSCIFKNLSLILPLVKVSKVRVYIHLKKLEVSNYKYQSLFYTLERPTQLYILYSVFS